MSKIDLVEMEKILPHQKYPYGMSEQLERIADDLKKGGLMWTLIEAYCLGIIDGKRAERRKRKE